MVRPHWPSVLLATLLLAQGTPMLLAGDEFGRTQNGNNNAYCQDNGLNWIDWENGADGGSDLIDFVRKLIALRKAYAILHRGRFIVGRPGLRRGRHGRRLTYRRGSLHHHAEQQWTDSELILVVQFPLALD